MAKAKAVKEVIMTNPQPVQMVASLTKERSHEVRVALQKMGLEIDVNDMVDLDAIDLQKLKKSIADDTPPRRQGVAARNVGEDVVSKLKGSE